MSCAQQEEEEDDDSYDTHDDDESSSCLGIHVKVLSLRGIEVDGYTMDVDDDDDDDDVEDTRSNLPKEIEEDDDEMDVEGDVEEVVALPPPAALKKDFWVPKQRLCCPITHQPFVNPVVCKKDGITYERDALIAREGDRGYYPNRAILDYMDPTTNPLHEILLHNNHHSTAISSTGNNNKKKTATTTTTSSSSSSSSKGIFVCVITGELMRDPVIDPDGYNYERAAIVDWIENHQQHGGVSPITRKPLRIDQLYDNTTLFRVLYREILYYTTNNNKNKDSIVIEAKKDEEIRNWKRDVSNFNYLTNNNVVVKKQTTSSSDINNNNNNRSSSMPQPQSSQSRSRSSSAAEQQTKAAVACRHPADMRVDYNGRSWRHENKNTVTLIGLLMIICLCLVVFLLFEFVIG